MESAFSSFKNRFRPTTTKSGIISRSIELCPIHGEYQSRLIGTLASNTTIEDEKYVNTYQSPCPLCADFEAQKKMSAAIEESDWKNNYELAGVPERFKESSIKNYVIYDDKQNLAIEKVKGWIRGEFYNLIALGRGGTGKSDLICASIRNLAFLKKSVKYVTEEQFCSDIKATYSNFNNLTEQDVKNKYYAYDYLVIDEVGRSAGSEKDINLIKTIIINRYENLKRTALVSNLTREDLEKRYDAAVYRKLMESSETFLATWESYSDYINQKKH